MTLPPILQNLTLPVIAAPMFIVSYPELVIAQCKAGIVGTFPALNARSTSLLDEWLAQINETLAAYRTTYPNAIVGPVAVNQIVHASNVRLEQDLRVCIEHRVPIIITSLSAPPKEIIDAIHAYGGIIFHDVIHIAHAQKALNAAVDGLILVAAGAGGHGGTLSPFALVGEVRRFFDGPIVLAGAIATGNAILAAQMMGADLAYIGTRFIATCEANAAHAYQNAIIDAHAADIIYTDFFTGVAGNYLRQSVLNAGLDPDHLSALDPSNPSKMTLKFSGHTPTPEAAKSAKSAKAWKDIWSVGQAVGLINDVPTVAQLVKRLTDEYFDARRPLG